MPEAQLIQCAVCGATNRVPLEKIEQGQAPVCGRCKNALPISIHPITVTDATFSAHVERSPLPVLLDLWAAWCGPCQMIAPVVEQLAKEMAGRIRVAKLNVDENPVTAERFHIRSIPALLILKSGQEIDRIAGAQPKSEIVRRLEKTIQQYQSTNR
jgi:thioredoxin 2